VPALVHLAHGHLGGHGAQRALELAGEQPVQVLGLQRAPPQVEAAIDTALGGRTRT
jgi:hypothetical protein